jgi:hypothetical protein
MNLLSLQFAFVYTPQHVPNLCIRRLSLNSVKAQTDQVKDHVLRLTGGEAKRADQPKIRGVEELRSRDDGKVASQTLSRRGNHFRGIAAEEQFVYEIMLLCLVMTLTSPQKLRKIRGIQHKRKDGQRAL